MAVRNMGGRWPGKEYIEHKLKTGWGSSSLHIKSLYSSRAQQWVLEQRRSQWIDPKLRFCLEGGTERESLMDLTTSLWAGRT